jgi:aldehyde dehydrogenase family 7 member A1
MIVAGVGRYRGMRLSAYRALSTRASTVLSHLDLPVSGSTEIPGVYDGEWKGSGDVLTSFCPTTGEELAKIRTVCTLRT